MKDMKRIYDMKNAIIRAVEKRLFSRCSVPVHFPFISRSAAVVILCILLGFSGQAWGNDCTYSHNRDVYNTSINAYEVIAQYSFTNSYGLASFSYKLTLTCTAAGADLTYKIQYLPANSNTWTDTDIQTKTLNGTWQAWRSEDSESNTVSISSNSAIFNARGIRIVSTKDFGTHLDWFKQVKTYRNVSVSEESFKMAKTLSGSTITMAFENQTYGTTSENRTRTFTFSNEATGKSISISNNTNSTEFPATISKSGDCTGTATISVQFRPTAQGTRKGNITISGDCGTKSFEVSGIGLRATPSLTANNGSVNVSIAGVNNSTINLSNLISNTGNGSVSYTIVSSNSSSATISGSIFSATQCGDYTIRATTAQTEQYISVYKDFIVTVNKLTPTIVWREPEHIYSGDLMENMASLAYSGNAVSNVGITLSSGNTGAMTVEGLNLRAAKNLTAFTNVVVTATTAETEHYKSVTATHTYGIEPKATPLFLLNGEDLPAEPVKELRLLIGETADMAFENTDETNGRFSYPIAAQYISYSHNSSVHTGTITATKYGDEVIQFHQTGTTTIFERTRSIHVYVSKHTTTLTTGLDGITCDVEDYIATEDAYSVNAPAEGEPAQNAVVITSSDENIIRFTDGKWRAKNAGTATLTIRQANNDYWTGDTITATITVQKKTPVITWNLENNYPWGAQVSEPVVSSNTELPFTVVSNHPEIANYVNGRIEVYNLTGDVTFTLTQAGNYKWNNASSNLSKTIHVYQPQNHVPFTITSDNKSDIVIAAENKATWDNNGYKMGDDKWILSNAPNSYIVIALTGIPDKLSFTKKCDKYLGQLPVDGDCLFEVYESSTNGNWGNAIWSYNKKEESRDVTGIPLSGSTRYIKLRYYGTVYGHFNNIKITERKEIVAPASQDFGSGYIGNNPTERTINVDWYNVKTCTVSLTGTNADCFAIAEGSTTIASSIDNYSTAALTIRHKHEVAGNHTATLHIESEDGKTADITLTGTTNKALQEIIWREDITPLPKNELYSGAAYATSGLPVVLTAEDPSILQVTNGDQVTGIGVGTTHLFARQAGDTKWEAVNETITVEVTNKTVQHIVWTDRLSNIKRENGQTVTKTLTAYSDADNTLPITYELDAAAAAFASVSGNTLTITGWGTGYITARQAGTDDYVAVSAMRKLVSRDPAAGCRPLVLDEPGEKTLHTIDSEEFPLQGEPATIEFDAKCDKVALWGLWVSEYYNGSWHEVAYIERGDMSSSYNHYGPYTLNRATTKIKIAAETGATLTRTFKNVEVTLAKYLELRENNMDFSAVEYGQTVLQQFTVDYSNLTGALDVELQNPSSQIEVRTVTLGEDCGDFAKNAVVQIRCTGRTIGTEQNTIVISNRDQRLEVPVSVTVIPVTQQITWNVVSPVATMTTDKVQLVATATSELPVVFTSADNNIAEPYQKEDGTWWLNIRSAGDVVITATQAGNTNYESTTTSRTYSISRVTPTIATLPTASATILPATLSSVALEGGQATTDIQGIATPIEGTFAWQELNTYVERVNSGYTVIFTPTNTDWYNTAGCTVLVPVLKTPQTITWDFTDTEMLCNADYIFDATASSGLSVRYTTSDASIAYVDADNRLRIIKGGEVTITAHQDGDETYAAAAEVEKTLTINRFTPSIVSLPAAESMLIGRLLSDASLSGGRVELDGVEVEGSFAWEEGNTRVETEAGVFERTVIFTPANTNWYNTLSDVMNVTVEKYAPAIYQSLTGTTLTYGQPLSNAAIEGSLTARDEVKYPQEDVQGTYTWKRPEEIVNAGSPAYATVVFTPDNLDWYKTAEFDIPLTVMPAELPAVSATSQIFYGQILSEASLTNTTYGVIDGGTALIAGTLAWDGSLDMMHYYELGTHTLPVIFTPSDPNYLPTPVAGTATLTVQSGFVFNGTDTNWDNINNWLDTNKPTNSNDKVVILSDVDITDEVEVEAMTIRDGVTVTVKDGATLTIGNSNSYYREQYGNIKVQKGGSLILGNGTLEVNNLYIESAMGGRNKVTNEFIAARSAQVENIDKINVHADVYFDLALDANGECSQGWYTFTVPFPVESGRGISRFENGVLNNNLKQGVNYAIMDYHENVRATGAYGWKKFYGTMQPGVCYTMTIDDYHNIYRFRKAQGAALTEQNSVEMTRTEGAGGEAHSGWNCIGNGSLHYAALEAAGITMVQVYDHQTNSYYPEQISGKTFVVGSTFFVQAVENNSLMSLSRTEEEGTLYALKRNRTDVANVLALTRKGDNSPSDRLFVTANYMAQDRYEAGKDVSKFELSSSVAQVYANAYNVKLCAVHTRLDADETIVSLGLYAPANGEYTLGLQQRSENQTVYLLYEGVVVANLTNQDYEIDLNKGTNSSYALLIRKQAPAMPTAIDETASDSKAEKFVHNGILYILRDGSLYDATGRKIEK